MAAVAAREGRRWGNVCCRRRSNRGRGVGQKAKFVIDAETGQMFALKLLWMLLEF